MTIQELNAPLLKISELQEKNDAIYGVPNRKYPDGDILLHVVERLTAISEGIRKDDSQEILPALAVFFMWLLSFCNRMGIDLEQAVWRKYHGCCPNCGVTKHCSCISAEAKPDEWFSIPDAEMPNSLTGIQKMFFNIYGRINNIAGLYRVFSHLSEEVGEISKAYRFRNYSNGNEREIKELENELADVFAHLVGICNSMRLKTPEGLLPNLAEITYAEYPDVCNTCKKPACKCPLV